MGINTRRKQVTLGFFPHLRNPSEYKSIYRKKVSALESVIFGMNNKVWKQTMEY